MREADILVALQRGLPICARPFETLADELGCGVDEMLDCLRRARENGTARRFGAVFDTRRLGYRSALCAATVPCAALDAAAAKVTPLVGVTHCYVRTPVAPPDSAVAPQPNLWFTLSCPADIFAAMADEVAARLAPYGMAVLPATRRYKVDVVFGAATRAREEGVEDDLPPVTAGDRAVIGALQGDTEVRADYFAAVAAKLNMKEWDLLSKLEMWRRNGRLKRIGLLLHHRNAGWAANGMCCWRVSGDTTAAGRALAARGEVTHCYERPEAPNFPYNLFAMVHARTVADAQAQYEALAAEVVGVVGAEVPRTMLLSTREYKKTSMTFFV
ncbi:MAG: hypothetical protein ACI4RA_00745 [Kiritimatiellia bacterium]